MRGVDETDVRIVQALQTDARLSHAAIGKEIGLTGPSVYARVKRLEQEGVIRGYDVALDPERLGQTVVAVIRIGTTGTDAEEEAFEQFMRDDGEILDCYDVDGEDSYILKVRTATPQTLRALIGRIRAFPHVSRTVTSIGLKTVKESTFRL